MGERIFMVTPDIAFIGFVQHYFYNEQAQHRTLIYTLLKIICDDGIIV